MTRTEKDLELVRYQMLYRFGLSLTPDLIKRAWRASSALIRYDELRCGSNDERGNSIRIEYVNEKTGEHCDEEGGDGIYPHFFREIVMDGEWELIDCGRYRNPYPTVVRTCAEINAYFGENERGDLRAEIRHGWASRWIEIVKDGEHDGLPLMKE